MVKKVNEAAAKDAAPPAGLFDSALAAQVKESAQQIWLAGMGAFAKAQAEGRQVFESLVTEGTSLQRKTQTAAEERLDDVATKMTSIAGEVSAKAERQWDRLETIFEERTAKALQRLGVPTAKDLAALSARIDALSAQLAQQSRGSGAATKNAPAKGAPPAGAKRAARKPG